MEVQVSHNKGLDTTMLIMEMNKSKTTTDARRNAIKYKSREYTYTIFPTTYTNKNLSIQVNIHNDVNARTDTNRNIP